MSTGLTLAIIPARGGSKGVPGKNLRPFQGEPLLVHSIYCGLTSPSVDRVVVSTDSPEIAKIANIEKVVCFIDFFNGFEPLGAPRGVKKLQNHLFFNDFENN